MTCNDDRLFTEMALPGLSKCTLALSTREAVWAYFRQTLFIGKEKVQFDKH